ncbi:MAG: 50S ribosomal protein L18e [Candidatus Aenigmarchaeota archaeon]|nr:50S ribosomal protein L18e [Candidatus Aenigmarchaeota archaeon]
MRTGPTNPVLRGTIKALESAGKNGKIWKDLAERLSVSTRIRASVNLAVINRHAKDGEVIAVPGKVLSYGNIDKKLTIGAFSFSSQAAKKIENAGGKVSSLEELAHKNPKGNKIRIMV